MSSRRCPASSAACGGGDCFDLRADFNPDATEFCDDQDDDCDDRIDEGCPGGPLADDAVAVSATGDGEYFIRSVVAYDIAARMMYADAKLEQAATEVIGTKLVDMGGGGGVIGVDRYGNVAMVMNTPGMYRASIDANGQRVVRIFAD